MPPRSVVLNVFTTARGCGKEEGVRETVAEVKMEGERIERGMVHGANTIERRHMVAAQPAIDIPQCAVCQSMTSPSGGGLLRCSRCRSTFYCNTKCQKADWKSHKKLCRARSTGSGSGSTSTPSTPVTPVAPSPMSDYHHEINEQPTPRFGVEADLNSMSKETMFAYLVDMFRVKVLDGAMGGCDDLMNGFRAFLDRAENCTGWLPQWWTRGMRIECETLAEQCVRDRLQESDIVKRWGGDTTMPASMRLSVKRVYGNPAGFFDQIEML
ncbi:hypothetical protein CC78DRAFT_524680 [Lojkania enalia]|uniref:MYND-type domain-containing protein n=1 Tax=Lojkania enalia TaxID=147567 RepID=A0A9P4JYE6_9PLEO|nr:hypothetical protein CC78DRAFT_524680 [Didymosphaeria enalia]